MAEGVSVQLCFPSSNVSCPRAGRPSWAHGLLYLLLALLSCCTVLLNLLVVLSIASSRGLQTPTNLLLLSLALADLCVGLLVMPVEAVRVVNSCWYFGVTFCAIFPYIVYMLTSSSLCSLVFISVDRYIAICDPLRYSSRVTVQKTVFCVCLGWVISVIYSVFTIYPHLTNPDVNTYCYGHCTVVQEPTLAIVDILITFIGPCMAIFLLYGRVFVVARKQMLLLAAGSVARRRGQRSVGVADSSEQKAARQSVGVASSSEQKAAKALGLVVMVYLMCWIPYYLCVLTDQSVNLSSIQLKISSWIVYISSGINPIIYALFYPWFRKSVLRILTVKLISKSFSIKRCSK